MQFYSNFIYVLYSATSEKSVYYINMEYLYYLRGSEQR
jgi:hypothetical protein